jgi:hypothetical protein
LSKTLRPTLSVPALLELVTKVASLGVALVTEDAAA